MLIKNDASPAMYPLLHPYGTLVYQAGRGDVHTVLVNGAVVKHEHRLVGVDLGRGQARRRATPSTTPARRWASRRGRRASRPSCPTTERIPNPYTYTDFEGSDDRHTARTE